MWIHKTDSIHRQLRIEFIIHLALIHIYAANILGSTMFQPLRHKLAQHVILTLMKPILIYLFTLILSSTGAPAVKHIRRNSILKDFRQAFNAFQCLLTTSWKFLYLKSQCFMLLLKLLLFGFILSTDAERVIFFSIRTTDI